MKTINFISVLLGLSLLLCSAEVTARRIALPPGVIIEGISQVTGSLFVGSNPRTGDMLLFDADSGTIATIARAPPGRASFGVHYDRRTSRMYVAGGGVPFSSFVNAQLPPNSPLAYPGNYTSAVHVYHLPTGNAVTSCPIPCALFLNDITMDDNRKYVYVTDSLVPRLFRLRVAALPRCDISSVQLPKDKFSGNNFFASGVQPYKGGLLVNNYGLGGVYFVDIANMKKGMPPKVTLAIDSADVVTPDGLQRKGADWLYVVSVTTNTILHYRLSFHYGRRTVSGRVVRRITSRDFSELSAVGVWGRTVVASNMNNTLFGVTGRMWLATYDPRCSSDEL